jgi:hypothetical protein
VSTGESILLLFVLFGLIPLLVWNLTAAARRHAPRQAAALGLRPAELGFEGRLETVRLRLAPNAVIRYPETRGTEPGEVVPSATGETLLVATLPRPIAFPFYLESRAVAGRKLLEGRVATGVDEVDAVLSILTPYEARATRLMQRTELRRALLALYEKGCCLFEIDSFDVAVHTAHHDVVVELGRDAALLARLLSRAAVESGYARSDPLTT